MSTTTAPDDPDLTAPAAPADPIESTPGDHAPEPAVTAGPGATDAPTALDPEPAEVAPAAARPSGRPWVLPVIAVVLVVAVIITGAALRSTNLDIDADQQAIASRSTQLSSDQAALATTTAELAGERRRLTELVDGLQRTQDQLELRSADRDQRAAKAEQTRVELFNLRASLNSQTARLYVQGKLLGDLQACLRSADQALNALSRGDTQLGGVILDGAKESCQVVNDYLAQQGLTT